jgi:hypothetical protein
MSKQSDLVTVSQGAAGDPLFIDTVNDRIGIGTSSPTAQLQVNFTTQQTDVDSATQALSIFNTAADTAGNLAGIRFRTENGTNNAQAFIGFASSGSVGTRGSMVFAPANTSGNAVERARIDSSGNFFTNATTFPAVGVEKFGVNGGSTIAGAFATNTNTNASVFITNVFDGTSTLVQFAGGPVGNFVGTITTNGTTTAYNTSSDYRLKENVVPLAGAADRLAQIPVCRFNFIADPDKTVDGFLAHEVQAFVPECVTGEKDQVETVDVKDEDGNVVGTEERPVYQGIDQSKLVPLLTAALQEALQKIDALETRISALETN